jgi:hypothetical protein
MERYKLEQELARLEMHVKLIPWVMLMLLFLLVVYADYEVQEVRWFPLTDDFGTFLSITAEILSAIIGLAIPLALNVIQMIQTRGRTTKLTSLFISEPIYRAQVVLFLLNITASITLALLNWPYVWIMCLLLFVCSMVFLYLFIRLIHKYSADLEAYLLVRYGSDVHDYFNEED